MRRHAGVLVLVAGMCLPTGSAQAAPALMCDGRIVTLTGDPGQSLAGTPGDDVIATDGATSVKAGAGDDLVCAWGGGPPPPSRSKVGLAATGRSPSAASTATRTSS